MRSWYRSWLNRRAFARAQAEAEALNGMVCGTVRADGRPIYYVVPREAKDAEIEAKAFELREGRGITDGEQILRSMAKRHRKGGF